MSFSTIQKLNGYSILFYVNWVGLRASLIYILILISSLATAQVNRISLDDIPTKKCTVKRFPVQWEAIDFSPPQQKVKSTLSNIQPEAFTGLKTIYLGKPIFEEFFPESVETKAISRSHVKDIARLEIQYLDKKHGLPSSSIYTMERDVNGNILFNTNATLNSFDGTELTSYYFKDTIGEIRHISAKAESKKWVSTTHGVFYQEGDSFFALKNNWGNHFWRATTDQEGVLWMTSYSEGIFFIKNDSLFQLLNDEIKFDSKEIIRDQKGQVWMACKPGVIRMSARDTVIFRMESQFGQACSIIEFQDEIYIGRFRKGIHIIKDDQVWELEMGIERYSVYDFEITKSGLWFTVYGMGLLLLEQDGHFHMFTEKDGLAQRSAHTLVSDDFGNIWVGDLFDGISIFSEPHFLPNHSLPRTKVITDINEGRDTVWFFFDWGTPIKKIGNTYYQMNIPNDFVDKAFLFNGAFEHGDKAWLQCFDHGYVRYENNTLFSYEYSNDPQESLNHQVSLDRFGRIWAINDKNELRFLRGDTIHLCHKKITESENIFHKVKQLIIDEDQELYFNNSAEVYWTQKDITSRHSFSSETIKYIFKHPQKGIWVLTDQQLHHMVKEKIINSYKFELPKYCNVTSAINVDNAIYLTTSEGFWELNIGRNAITFEKAFGHTDFSRSQLFHYQDELMISGAEFNNHYRSWWNLNKDYQPKLSIKAKSVAGIKKSNSAAIELSPEDKMVVEINYQDWGKNRKLQYQLTKDENAQGWLAMDGKSLSFDNLSSGDYRLDFRASNQSKKWVKADMTFQVAPFWYESQWFFLLLISFILVAFYYLYRYRVNRAMKIEQQLNKAVDMKTKELAEEKKQVEKQLQQKELLLKEVNHRVMNNMQMVSSILELQNSKTTDLVSRENLDKARNRIKALALAHQHLYKYEEYETIVVVEYLSVIEKSLKLEKNIQITLNIEPDLKLPIDQTQSLGLVLNELISNSIKHAWTNEDDDKQITVTLTESEQGYRWVYIDNGQGLQNNLAKNNGLGTTLIKAITARQLSGDLEYALHNGFKLIINFPKL